MIDTNKYEGHTPAPWWMPSMELRGSSEPVVKMATFKREPSLADRTLIADAPLLLEEVKRLRGQLGQAREFLWWCYDKERFGWEIDEKGWNLIGRLLGAYTDHNDNEWSEEE